MKIFLFLIFFTNISFSQENYFIYVEEPPVYPGCDMIRNKRDGFECSKVQFTKTLLEKLSLNCNGEFIIDFVVSKNGHCSLLEIKKDSDTDCNIEKIILSTDNILKSSVWLPGKFSDTEVDVKISLPIKMIKKK